MYPEIGDDFYGIKLVFEYDPVSGLPIREFVFSNHELVTQLAQLWPQTYEGQTKKLEFVEPADYPVKAVSPHEWLDLAQLLRQAKKHSDATPKLTMDIGGRKIIARIPICRTHQHPSKPRQV